MTLDAPGLEVIQCLIHTLYVRPSKVAHNLKGTDIHTPIAPSVQNQGFTVRNVHGMGRAIVTILAILGKAHC